MILFCIPYAGGAEQIYSNWNKVFSNNIVVKGIKLKGRGSRFNEEFSESINEAVDDIYIQMEPYINTNEYGIFGHSMGALLTYELYYKILKEKKPVPKHMFFSGNGAPNIKKIRDISYKMKDDIFLDRIGSLGGTPKEFLENDELIKLILPILKNDFRLIEEYEYVEKENKIKCNITVLNGDLDNITYAEKFGWKELCEKSCDFYDFNGGHFFINDCYNEVIKVIEDIL
ncbi:thioesterase [Clostridium gasigenes]|uniref:thioesterase II family protein n=1 Tax=Clostridium gasigenes TaxID=94869 RepID=UPI0014386A46|nr:thioesterase [Clostridium gasigenes]NKF08832.1 thioesterase [Clostridium gasigenes]QSW21244.1 thioesterase [Clostridium gasigenes]